jgi:diacylglycerol O-acyltransferase
MGPLDSVFLHVEDGVTHMHIASCAIFEGPPPRYEEFAAMVAGRLPLLTRYRQKVRFVPADIGRPVWVDDPHFNLVYHLRQTALPSPGSSAQLDNLMGRLMSVELDRHRPLWEAWMVEGLSDGRWALISKVHHCMVDGVSGTDLMTVLLDATPDPSPPLPDAWTPRAEPSDGALTFDALLQLALRPAERARAAAAMMRRPRDVARSFADTVQGMRSLGQQSVPTPVLSIEGGIGPHRRWSAARSSLEDIKEIRGAFGGTVNDVVLTVITSAFRDLLLASGDHVDGAVIHSLVPVNVRRPGDVSANNQVSGIIANLPVGIADPVERLAAVRADMANLKASHQADAGQSLTSIADLAPPTLFALTLRNVGSVLRRMPQHSVNTVTTNVHGPDHALYAIGRKMLEYLPFVPLSQGVRLGVAILSYDGHIAFGVTGDFDTVADVEWFCRRIEAAIAELRDRARTLPEPVEKKATKHAKKAARPPTVNPSKRSSSPGRRRTARAASNP